MPILQTVGSSSPQKAAGSARSPFAARPHLFIFSIVGTLALEHGGTNSLWAVAAHQ